ncbi:tRNA modification GTPase MnmE [Spirochaetia bacterium]|nr:tRNA modification GTPase MnmE [Spirochaetia bacterium]
MPRPSYGDIDPIFALATPPAESALALIRVSGVHALDLLAVVFSRPGKLLEAPGNTIVHGWVMAAGEKLDEVLISVYRAPRSYTGEEGADISCHGGMAAVKAILGALKTAGFRDALPGEFTFRAFMNGKLDLTRAESVMELVAAKTDRGREHAVGRLAGGLEQEIAAIKTQLVQVLAGTELYLDYSEDELGAVSDRVTAAANAAIDDETAGRLPDRPFVEAALVRLRALAASYRMERLYAKGALAVIAGRPNAGKSSLFNLLLKEDRSIVTDIPGTTRDWIEAWISLGGIPIRLIDTAGLHDSEDPVERLGMARSRELLQQADIILYIIDGTEGITGEDRRFLAQNDASAPLIPIWNKADISPLGSDTYAEITPLRISAKTGEGLPSLTTAIIAQLETAYGGSGTSDSMGLETGRSSTGIGTARQKELIDRAIAALEDALDLADQGEPLDLIAPLLREGVNSLGEITGEVSTADILEAMFSRFCVGK